MLGNEGASKGQQKQSGSWRVGGFFGFDFTKSFQRWDDLGNDYEGV